MSYVHVPPATTGRARALADRIVDAIDGYRGENPRTSEQDVDEALRLARARVRVRGAHTSLAIALLVGLALVAGLFMLVYTTGVEGIRGGGPALLPFVIIVVIGMLGLVVFLTSRRQG